MYASNHEHVCLKVCLDCFSHEYTLKWLWLLGLMVNEMFVMVICRINHGKVDMV